jgi:hypothetical protein
MERTDYGCFEAFVKGERADGRLKNMSTDLRRNLSNLSTPTAGGVWQKGRWELASYAAKRKLSTCRSQDRIRFQLANVWLTISFQPHTRFCLRHGSRWLRLDCSRLRHRHLDSWGARGRIAKTKSARSHDAADGENAGKP